MSEILCYTKGCGVVGTHPIITKDDKLVMLCSDCYDWVSEGSGSTPQVRQPGLIRLLWRQWKIARSGGNHSATSVHA